MDITTPTTNSVDLRKTFDLNGKENDEMLRLYLRKAGLSDEIEYLTPEQRRAYIYDIIKSNQSPGFWRPSVLSPTSSNTYASPPPSMRLPLRPADIHSNNSSPYVERRSNTSFSTMRSSISANSLLSPSSEYAVSPRFVPATTTPPSPTTFITGSKGSKYEISGPINFQHIAGDLTRDKTRNAFDLSSTMNDNVLKKYMIEHGISDDDVAGMSKQDIIRKIVQSKFTWEPPKSGVSQRPKKLDIKYATVSGRSEKIRPSIATTPDAVSLSPMSTIKVFPSSNFILVSSRFADVSEFPDPSELSGNKLRAEQIKRLSQIKKPNVPPPPPPQIITATVNNNDKLKQMTTENTYDTLTLHKPRPLKANTNYMLPQPPKQQQNPNNEYMVLHSVKQIPNQNQNQINDQECDDYYEIMSTENIAQKKLAKPTATSPMAKMPPIPKTPPPNLRKLEFQNKTNQGSAPIPPPPPPPPPLPPPFATHSESTSTPAPPPAPTFMPLNKAQTATSTQNDGQDGRDALMESIKKGINLKKVDQKAATVSGVKPRATNSRPQITDFLTELKMGVTSRRIKNSKDNPFANDESFV